MQMRTPNSQCLIGPKSTILIGQNEAALIGQKDAKREENKAVCISNWLGKSSVI